MLGIPASKLAVDLGNVDVEVATTLKEAHVRDTRTFFTRTRFTRRSSAVIQVRHRITITIVTRLVDKHLRIRVAELCGLLAHPKYEHL